MQLSDSVATRFPPLCHLFEVGIEPRHTRPGLLFRKGVPPQPARNGRMANPHLRGDGRLREALLAQGHDMLVLSQALFSLRLASHGLLRTQFRRSFPPPPWTEGWLLPPARCECDEQQNDAPASLLVPVRDFSSHGIDLPTSVACGAEAFAAAASSPPRSRLTAIRSGEWRIQGAAVSALRSGRRSATRLVSRLTKIVP
jgi:hypothetical protein